MSHEQLQAQCWRARAALLVRKADEIERSEAGLKPDGSARHGGLLLTGVALGAADRALPATVLPFHESSGPNGLQNRLDPAIEARLTEVVQRLRAAWLAGPALLWSDVHPIHELAVSEVEKRVALTLRLGFFQFSQFIAGFEVLLLQLEQLGLVNEQLILSLEELAIDLGDSSRLGIEVAEIQCRLRQLLRTCEGRHE